MFLGQLRYVIRYAPAPRYGPGISEKVLVLQQVIGVADADDMGIKPEWADVPTEDEE